MTHDQIVTEIQARAARVGVLSHYCKRAKTCDGDNGLPDLVLVGLFGAAWIEVKTPGDRLSPGQTTWRHMLQAARQVHEVMYAADLAPGGAVDMMLAFVGTGDAALGDYTRSATPGP